MKVAVIVDDLDPALRRTSFWEDRLAEFPDLEVDVVSLLDQMDKREFFNVYQYQVIIFNWCVLDGALMYHSDRAQQIVEFFDDHFRQFVKKGNVLIFENQPKRWHPSQRAYDTLFRGEIAVKTTAQQVFGEEIVRNPQLLRHPLFQHLPARLYSNYPSKEVAWFPPNSTGAASLAELHPRKIYSGGFARWKADWLPLMFDKDGEYPVMLAKTDGLGMYLVTTMYMASSNINDLLDSIFVEWPRKVSHVIAFHERHRFDRLRSALLLVALSVVAAGIVAALFITNVIHLPDSFGGTILGDVIVSIAFGVVVFALTRFARYVLRLARHALNR